MASVSLSRQDMDILGKIVDPESSSNSPVRIDASLPKDPHITDPQEYAHIAEQERAIVLALQKTDMEMAGLQPRTLDDPLATYHAAVADLERLIAKHPDYASARNNRAQALRRLYGDDMLLRHTDQPDGANRTGRTTGTDGPSETLGPRTPVSILHGRAVTDEARAQAAAITLADLDRAIELLMPDAPDAPDASDAGLAATALSPTASKTLSQALSQRGALYYATANHLDTGRALNSDLARPEASWTKAEFDEAAARNFDLGGRFGNPLARAIAVGINPTAKLCGQMVQQMIKDEYAPDV